MASNRDYDSIGEYDPATESELRKLRRREKMAEMLAAQSIEPLQAQSTGRFTSAISPWQGIGKMAQAYASNRSDKRNDEKYSEIVNALAEQQNTVTDALTRGLSAKQYVNPDTGTPQVRGVNGNMVPTEPAGGIEGGLAAMQGLPPSKYANEIRQTLALKLAEQDAEKQMAAYKSTLPEYGKNKPFPDDVQKQMIDIAAAKQQDRAPYFTPVYTPNGPYTFNNRAGNMYPTPMQGGQQAPATPVAQPGLPGAGVAPAPAGPLLPAQYDPKLQGEIAGAKKGAESQAVREFNMSGIEEVIDAARATLTGVNKPTGSGIGTVADYGAAQLGITLKGGPEADQLRAIGGALITKMPRMEGPQGVLDVELYKEEAGKVGDSTIPIDRRLKALEAVEALWRKYGGANKDMPGNETGAALPASRSRIIKVEP